MTATALAAGLRLGHSIDGTLDPVTLAIGVFGIAVAVVAWMPVQRPGEPAHALLVEQPA